MEYKNGLYIVAIVGLVAVVALVIMLSGGNKASVVYTGTNENMAGQAMAWYDYEDGNSCPESPCSVFDSEDLCKDISLTKGLDSYHCKWKPVTVSGQYQNCCTLAKGAASYDTYD
jgi:hypothetical protein